MKVEVWSDILCPFCYIGKRHFEEALSQFEHKDEVEVIWRSFQLNPHAPEQSDKNVYAYLAESKGISLEQSMQMHENVVQMAKNAGLDYRFDKAVVANSFKAHCLLQAAKKQGLGDKAKERILKAYFEEGANIGSQEQLTALGKEIGLSEEVIADAFANPMYADAVRFEMNEAQELGIQGVPMFVFNRKYGVSGAQPAEVFLEQLKGVYAEGEQK